jgi:hypothetical protein
VMAATILFFITGCLFSKLNGFGLAAPWTAVSTYRYTGQAWRSLILCGVHLLKF